MAKLWAIIKREYLERVRSKWFLIATFLGPIFFAAIIIVPAWIASKSKATSQVYNTTILDVTGTGFGQRLALAIAGDTTDKTRIPEVRVVAPDDIPLSTAFGRETGYIAVHVYQHTPYDQYFQGVEAIMNDYDGRPHWGKMHFQTAATLAPVTKRPHES